jgi:hypothetical protein
MTSIVPLATSNKGAEIGVRVGLGALVFLCIIGTIWGIGAYRRHTKRLKTTPPNFEMDGRNTIPPAEIEVGKPLPVEPVGGYRNEDCLEMM